MKRPACFPAVCAAVLALMLGTACDSESPVATLAQTGSQGSYISTAGTDGRPVSVLWANLHLYPLNTSSAPVTVHRITGPWEEATVTSNSFGSAYDPGVLGSLQLPDMLGGWCSANVTGLAAAWFTGEHPNFGLLLDQQTEPGGAVSYRSRENTEFEPLLEIGFETEDGGVVLHWLTAAADTYIWEGTPYEPYGDSKVLYTGRPASDDFGTQSLILFEIPGIPPPGENITPSPEPLPPGGGCTLGPGYWKTRSAFGPAPYDDTWAMLDEGASTPFFLSGQTYYQVLWTPPAGGNTYYILAHAYIAAELNRLSGADFTDAQDAFGAATHLLDAYTPADIAVLRGNAPLRKEFISLAGSLEHYNNGWTGPGHCHD